MISTRKLGSVHEDRAKKYLISKNYQILDSNWHWSNRGEIDIIAIDPNRFGQEYYIFVEVKYRSSSMEMALSALDHRKIKQLKILASVYILQKGLYISQVNISFDLLALHKEQIIHVENFLSL